MCRNEKGGRNPVLHQQLQNPIEPSIGTENTTGDVCRIGMKASTACVDPVHGHIALVYGVL